MLATVPLWLILVITAGISMAGYDVCVKLSGGKINGVFFSFIIAVTSAIVTLAILLFTNNIESAKTLVSNKSGAFYGILTGVSVAITNICFFYMFSKGGGEVSTCVPLASIINFVLIIVIGVFFFSESVTPHKITGLAMAVGAIILLSK
ncbi:MAG: EamA family transporter [Alphaproteobacteria bacterium]|nr:EamA family transporter [Alphaproteobacteria bacterium]